MNVMAIQGDSSNIPVIGDIIWYSVPDSKISRSVLETVAKQCKIPDQYLPGKIVASDAFKRATTTMAKMWQNKTIDLGNGYFEKLLVRNVVSSESKIVRNVVAEIRDTTTEVTKYRTIARLTFDYVTGNVDVCIMPDELSYKQDVDPVLDAYNDALNFYNGQTIRNMVKGIVDAMSPTRVRPSGAVYFVPREYSDLLGYTEEMVIALNKFRNPDTEEATFVRIPLVDSTKQREMVQKSLENQVTETVDRAIEEMSLILKGDTVKKSQLTKFVNMSREMNETVGKYEALLEKELLSARNKKDIFNEQVVEALKKVTIEEDNK